MTPQARLKVNAIPAPAPLAPRLRICHVMSADLWAGAEVQLATTAAYLTCQPDVSVAAVLFNDGPLAAALRRLGISVTIIDEARTTAFGILRQLTQFFRSNRFDLVHTHRYKDSVLGACAAKLAGVPHVVRTVHGLREPMTGWSALKFRVYEAIDRLALLWFADLVIAVSARMAETLRASGYRPTGVTKIHNGIDLRTVVPSRSPEDVRRELGIATDAVVIGTAGRLSPVKGHAGFLQAARLILQACPKARFVIVGSGPLEAELRGLADRLKIADACVLTGARDDVSNLMAGMDIFVLPSLHEGLPMAVLEAMALGRPVVATAVGGVPEVIEDGKNGLLVQPGDDKALAAACIALARDRSRALTLGSRARQFVAERFSHEQCGRALLAAYRSVALVPRSSRHAGERQREAPDRQARRSARSDGTTLRIVPDTARGRGPAASPARSIIRPANVRAIGPVDFCSRFVRLGASRASRKMQVWTARRAMSRLRRQPGPVAETVRSAASVLIVCHGNIIRSPFAAHLVRQAASRAGAVSVMSAGLEAEAGKPAHPVALELASARQIDLQGHSASPLTAELVARSDVIFVMDAPQLVSLRRRFPEAGARTFLLTCLAADIPLEVADPVDGDASRFHACFDHISRAVRPIARILSDSPR